MRRALAVAFVLALVDVPVAKALQVTRGPYLQIGTPTSIVVRWHTDEATDSRVTYGAALGEMGNEADDASVTTEHEVNITDLLPATKYHYAVGDQSASLAGADTEHFFITAPLPGTPVPTRIWAIGDSGTANNNARAVRDAYYGFAGNSYADVWLMLGDNAYPDGTDAQYQAAVFDMYPETLRQTVVWPTLGNHDARSASSPNESGVYYGIFSLPKSAEAGGLPSGTEAYYSFDYGNIHFICLDSHDSPRATAGAMLTWLQSDLSATLQDWVIAFWHHPPYSRGSHNSDNDGDSGGRMRQMRENALPILEEAGVDLVLSGHSHSYERSFLLHGHYGKSTGLTAQMIVDDGDGSMRGAGPYAKSTANDATSEGAVYAVAGSSGKTSGGSLNHPVMFTSFNTLGSMAIEVEALRLDAVFLDNTGSVLDDFTIEKGRDGTAVTARNRLVTSWGQMRQRASQQGK
ncbi:metallophosphoesterase family protein [Candidatus Poribacteria bacterium]|jgi:acid phosphatase type 7|nr:metallophosphoesterase family protein [Candidatus Poribacteria bacterium]MBT5535186.1 metallophosphoesterase family protein [Candidatus Poribacteria bacterium]MBT7100479.1 metallophosphoesterase family protein [Candidatus Poribacteria bacterium]MBT7808806.1 metallophosphoesterase family protein [Candidatus Poribacteria bacterium]